MGPYKYLCFIKHCLRGLNIKLDICVLTKDPKVDNKVSYKKVISNDIRNGKRSNYDKKFSSTIFFEKNFKK